MAQRMWPSHVEKKYTFCFLLGLAAICGLAVAVGAYVALPILVLPVLFPLVAVFVTIRQGESLVSIFGVIAFAFLVLWPRYAYLRFGGLPGVTPSRVFFFLAFALFAVSYVRSACYRSFVNARVAGAGSVSVFLVLLVFFRLLSVAFAKDPLPMIFPVLNEVMFLGASFVLCLSIVKNLDDVDCVVRCLAALVFVVCLLSIVEYVKKKNLFVGVLPVSDEYAQQALLDKVRDSGYRAQATFDHPLSFAQFLVTAIPLVVVGLASSRSLLAKGVWSCALVLSIAGVVASGTRSAVFVVMVSMFFLFLFVFLRNFYSKRMTIRGVLVALLGLFVLCAGAFVFGDSVTNLVAGRTSAEASSSYARMKMLEMAVPAVVDSPLVGYGVNQAAEKVGFWGGGVLSIDSLPISFVVESGIGALLSYIFVIVCGVARALRSAKASTDHVPLGLGVSASLIAFFISSFTLSLKGNFYLLAIMLCVAVVSEKGVRGAGKSA